MIKTIPKTGKDGKTYQSVVAIDLVDPTEVPVKVSDSLVNGAFGANGDNKWRQWMLHCRQWRFGEWRRWRSQSPLAPMATSIGANGDRH